MSDGAGPSPFPDFIDHATLRCGIMLSMTRLESSSGTNQLLERLPAEPNALAELFARHKERLRRMVRVRLDPRLRATLSSSRVLELVYQDLCRRIEAFQEQGGLPFYLWLRQLAGVRLGLLCQEHLGDRPEEMGQEVTLHRGALPAVNSVALAAQLLGQPTATTPAATRTEMQIRLQDALNRMEPMEREILVLCHFEDLSNAEAAIVLGVEPKVAGQGYVRAVKKLKEIMSLLSGFDSRRP
jgi:RNA polymerase sigma-70 factor (ECF subfamily)